VARDRFDQIVMTIQLEKDSKLLRIFIGELDKYDHKPLYEALVYEAKKQGIAGATVLRGILSYGASSRIHTAKLLDLSFDLPIVVEIIDSNEKIEEFIETASKMIDRAECGALITVEKVEVIHYKTKKH
jgi:PII-like signaling protein